MEQTIIAAIKRLIENDEALKAAGVKRQDPSTWRPDLIRPLGESNADSINTGSE